MPKISFLGAMEVVQNVVHGQTDRPTDRQTDKATYRSSQPELKNIGKAKQNKTLNSIQLNSAEGRVIIIIVLFHPTHPHKLQDYLGR